MLLCSCSLLLLVIDLSLCSLQLSSSPDTNGSYSPGKVTFTCVGVDVPFEVSWRISGSILYTYTFENQSIEIFPEVLFESDAFILTVNYAVVSSELTQNISIKLSGNVCDLLKSTVSCETTTPQESESYFILSSGNWTAQNLTFAILAPVICLLNVIVLIWFGFSWHRRNASYNKYKLAIWIVVISPGLLMFYLLFWIMGLVTASISDQCSTDGTFLTSFFFILACIFSALAVMMAVTAIALLYCPLRTREYTLHSAHYMPEYSPNMQLKNFPSDFDTNSAYWDPVDVKHISYCGDASEETWRKHGFIMEFQENSLPSNISSADIDVCVYVSGNFKLPDNVLPVSAFYNVLCSCELLKDVCLKIEHCAIDISNLRFAVSSDNCPPYEFEIVKDGIFFEKHGEIKRKRFSRFVIIFFNTLASCLCPMNYYSALCSSPWQRNTWTIRLFVTLCTRSHIYYLKEDAKKNKFKIQDSSELQIERNTEFLEMDITLSDENRQKGLDLLVQHKSNIRIYIRTINNIWYNETASASFKLKLTKQEMAIFHQPYSIKGAILSNDCLHLSLCTDENNMAMRTVREDIPVNVHGSSLGVANLSEVFDQCYDVRNKWYNFGLRLIPDHVSFLDANEDSSRSNDDKLRSLLKKWLEVGEERTWSAIYQALRHHTVARPDIAENIVALNLTRL